MEDASPYILVDGAVGAGKSSITALLSRHGFQPYYEPVTENPFLERFYGEPSRWSLASQLFFLLSGYRFSLEAARIRDAVVDRSFYGHAVFAGVQHDRGNLDAEEYALYRGYHAQLARQIPAPRLLVFLDTGLETSLNRIRSRGRDFEQDVDVEYWAAVHQATREYVLQEYDFSPYLILPGDEFDILGSPEDAAEAVRRVRSAYEG